jgi:hypothetical protein
MSRRAEGRHLLKVIGAFIPRRSPVLPLTQASSQALHCGLAHLDIMPPPLLNVSRRSSLA